VPLKMSLGMSLMIVVDIMMSVLTLLQLKEALCPTSVLMGGHL